MVKRYVRITLSLAQAKALQGAAWMGHADAEMAKIEQEDDYNGPNLRKLEGALEILRATIANVETKEGPR